MIFNHIHLFQFGRPRALATVKPTGRPHSLGSCRFSDCSVEAICDSTSKKISDSKLFKICLLDHLERRNFTSNIDFMRTWGLKYLKLRFSWLLGRSQQEALEFQLQQLQARLGSHRIPGLERTAKSKGLNHSNGLFACFLSSI